ncbi:hypothetical protein CBW22_13080 [Pantoea sp. VS1]|uniref:hypothetical protein n=1 Tax=Pantoea sp. VS1 TaxID=2003658 RepID=UPI000B503132|nr:hypothetical protein [Pantoea sp. VS1]OWS75203.1 hypothetical protein CBW22_13080 [Pantoea sp. VS1]
MSKQAVPANSVTEILEALSQNDIVALCDGAHGCLEAHKLRMALINDPRFPTTVNKIVVEWGNSLYQDTMDRFLNGEDIAACELRKVWQNTTQPHDVWDKPIFEQFFQEVRKINSCLPRDQHIRIILGDPPINWSNISSSAQYQDAVRSLEDRDFSAVRIIQREVIDKCSRALVIYGAGHFLRQNFYWKYSDADEAKRLFEEPANTIVSLLEERGAKVYSIWSAVHADLSELQRSVAAWPTPSLAHLKDTTLGRTNFSAYYPQPAYVLKDGVREKIYQDSELSPSMQEQFDAVLYFGPPQTLTWSEVPVSLSRNDEYLKMRTDRLKWSGLEKLLSTS